VQQRAGVGADHHRQRIRNGVIDGDELDLEHAELLALAFAHF